MTKINQEKQTNILIEVSKLLQNGHSDEVTTLIENIKIRQENDELPEDLKKILEKVKNNPIDEPEIFELNKKVENQEASIIELVLKFLTEEELDKHSADDISFLAGKIARKVSNKKDDNGVFKTTPNTSTWERPKPSQVMKFEKLQNKKAENEKAGKKKQKDLEDLIYKSCKIDKSKLTEWEQELVVDKTIEAHKGYLNSFMGKR